MTVKLQNCGSNITGLKNKKTLDKSRVFYARFRVFVRFMIKAHILLMVAPLKRKATLSMICSALWVKPQVE